MAKKTKEPEIIAPEESTDIQLIVSGTLPVITSNFEELKSAIALKLEEYRIEVTEDNLAQAKKDATDLGKAATQLNKLKTEKAKEFSAPVDAFKDQVMELVKMIQEGQEHIKSQVKVFEDKTRALCKQLMTDLIHDQYTALNVRAEYQNSWKSIDSIVGISLVSKVADQEKRTLTKAGRERIEQLAANDKAAQDRADLRIAQLENICLKAGLISPLTIEHVRPILDTPDSLYHHKINALVEVELQRQKATQEAAIRAEQEKVRAEQEKIRFAEEAKKREELARERAEYERQEAEAAKQKAEEQIKSAEAERQLQEAQTKIQSCPAASPIFPASPAFPVSPVFPTPPNKKEVYVHVRFKIKTTKAEPEDIRRYKEWFQTEFKKNPALPPAEIDIQTEDDELPF